MPAPPILIHAKSDMSTDDNQDSDREGKRKSKKTAEERYLAGLSGARIPSRKKKKVIDQSITYIRSISSTIIFLVIPLSPNIIFGILKWSLSFFTLQYLYL